MPDNKKEKVKKKASPTSKPAKAFSTSPTVGRRQLKIRRSGRLPDKNRTKVKRPPLPGAPKLFWRSLKILRQHWRLFLIITIIYGLLNILLVKGLAGGSNLTTLKNDLQSVFNGHGGQLATGMTVFVYLLGGSGNNSSAGAGVYQMLLFIITSLAVIWALRQVYSGTRIRARDSFYRGMYPLVPFILVLLVIILQLVPLLLGSYLFYTVTSAAIAVHAWEKWLFLGILLLLSFISLYMICSSIFAALVATLPDMTPMKALRSARKLVLYRRFAVFRKLLFLPIAMLLIAIVIMFPLILYATVVASWTFFVLSMAGLIVANAYIYALYRELLV